LLRGEARGTTHDLNGIKKGLSRGEAHNTTRELNKIQNVTTRARAVHTGAGPRAREASARGCTRARERGSAMERREGREERGTHHGLDGRQQPLTEIHPRAGRQMEDREREVTLRGKERMREWGVHGGGASVTPVSGGRAGCIAYVCQDLFPHIW
jgi:hypothetical protein